MLFVAAFVVIGLPIQPPPFVPTSLVPANAEALAATGNARVIAGSIGRGATLAAELGEHIGAAGVHALVEAARETYDLARVQPGRPYRLTVADGALRSFAYSIDELNTLRVFARGEALIPELATRTYETRVETARGVIESSLFGSIDAIGEKDQLAVDLSEIFAWDIDFNTMLQPGDTFRVAVEKLYLDGELRRYGRILAAEFVNSGAAHTAIRFDGASGEGYYDLKGDPLKKAFLKSPLRFTRVSSRFSSGRFHPILHRTRAHNGADLAAGYGTPVRAIGHGAVTAAGTQGGYGKVVTVRHANGFVSLYGHLSKISVRPGQRVDQGDIVGLVGSTGLATGPHLHFGMTKNGRWTDPMRVQSPPAEPLAASDVTAFATVKTGALALLPPRAALLRSAAN